MEVMTMEAGKVLQLRSRLRREISHNPGGITSVMSNRRSCLASTDGDDEHTQSLRLQIEILEEIQEESTKPIVRKQSRPRF